MKKDLNCKQACCLVIGMVAFYFAVALGTWAYADCSFSNGGSCGYFFEKG